MPFKSEAQRKYLWANEPEIARDWTDTYGSGIKAAQGGRIGFEEGDAVGGSLSELADAGFHAGVSRDVSGTTGEGGLGGGDYVSPG